VPERRSRPVGALPAQQPLEDRYREALEAQQEIIRGLMGR
jgi:hypothetical protein